MFAPSPSPTISPSLARSSLRTYHAQPVPLSPRSTTLRHEQRNNHRSPPTLSPRTRVDQPIVSVIPITTVASRVSSPSPASPSPQASSRRRTADATTQYTPPGLPPTAKSSQRINLRTGQVQDLSSGTGTPSSASEGPSHHSRLDLSAGGGPEVGPLAGPPGPPQSREIASQGSNGRPKTPEQVLVPDKTPGESRTRVKDVIGPPIARDGHRRMDEDADEDGFTSSPKKARHEHPPVKTMPLKYEDCDVKDLGLLISDMLLELVRHNDALPLKDRQLTRFHSRAPPGISVTDYLSRLITHATLTPPLLLSMVYYIDRLCALYPVFTISSLTVHRFLITAATVAAKGLSDSFWTNNTYARVGGVTTRELALLELEFLEKMDWRIVPRPEVLRDYYRSLVERAEGYELEQRHPSAPTIEPQDVKTSGKEAESEEHKASEDVIMDR